MRYHGCRQLAIRICLGKDYFSVAEPILIHDGKAHVYLKDKALDGRNSLRSTDLERESAALDMEGDKVKP